MEVFDVKYSESFRSLRTEHNKEYGFFMKILAKGMKEICLEITALMNKFIQEQKSDYKSLERFFNELRIHYENQLERQ